ncbi:unnamed protein product, partial [Heterosigma akashiwo]
MEEVIANQTISGEAMLLAGVAPYINARGQEFYQLFQYYPALEPFYFDWEKNYNPKPVLDYMGENSWLPILSVIAYMAFCYYGQILMKDRKAFSLKMALAVWNLGLSAFSFIGVIRVAPHLAHLVYFRGMEGLICLEPGHEYGSGATGLWIQLFILSKFPELIDTVFIV